MRPTREGKRFFLAALLIALAAFNTGNNLIYLILSMMLSIFLLSIVILKINMRKLVLKVSQDNPIYANTPSSISMVMANKKSIDSHSVKVMSSGAFAEEIYLPLIPARSEITNTAQVMFRKRGIYKYRDFFIESEYPVCFFQGEGFEFRKGRDNRLSGDQRNRFLYAPFSKRSRQSGPVKDRRG